MLEKVVSTSVAYIYYVQIALLKAQVSLQLGNVSSSDNGVSLSIMYSYTYIAYG